MTGRLILVRHGEPLGHLGRCIGHHDTELSAAGAESVRGLATSKDREALPALVVSSDLGRAADSAAILAGAWKAELRFDPRLRELSFGHWEGRAWDDISRDDRVALDHWGVDWTTRSAPGGETGVAMASRARGALDDLTAIAIGARAPVAVVGHAGWIRVATTILLGEPLGSAFDRSIDYARAAIFDLNGRNVRLERWNVDNLEGAGD